ncbi:MAG TPA: nitrogen fixation protein NifH [Actinomycetota bacterium]|nr:nitrogen fixation protein NifH [Actinomycetota bacterium]
MGDWRRSLNGDPLPWLLEPDTPAVRHATLLRLLDEPEDSAAVRRVRAAAMRVPPIATILEAQEPDGWWVKPGGGYGPKYTGTVWSVIFLDQLGADGADPRIRRAAEYVLSNAQAPSGGFGSSGRSDGKPPGGSDVIHCLNGNLLRALIGFGWLDDPRVRRSIDWQSRSITGEDFDTYYRSGTSGPGFGCAVNEGLPCAWGATKALLALARIPPRRRAPHVRRAVEAGSEFLLSVDPATARYPMGWGNTAPSRSWFRFGFPSGYVADVLQDLEALAELGHARDPRLSNAVDLVLSKQDAEGRWRNEYAYNGKMWIDVEPQGLPSKWVTLRACSVLKRAG